MNIVSITTYDLEGNKIQVSLPGKMVVCPRCNGRGVVDAPAFSNGISPEEFAEDLEFSEQYRSGMFDVTCHVCSGKNVVPEVDEDRLSPDQREIYEVHQEYLRGLAEMRAVERAEQRMGF